MYKWKARLTSARLCQTITVISCVYRASGNELSACVTASVRLLDGLTAVKRSACFTGIFSKGLTGDLLQKQTTDYEEVIEKLFSKVRGLEDCPKIPDPQVDSTDMGQLCVFMIMWKYCIAPFLPEMSFKVH